MDPHPKGYVVTLKLRDALTSESKAAVREYVMSYAEVAGWHVGGVVFATRYIRFLLSRELSRAR